MPDLPAASLIAPAPGHPLVSSRIGRLTAGDELQTLRLHATANQVDGNYVRGVRRLVYLALAGLFFVLGIIGIVLPGLPTTPFLLLTSYFLARSWPRMHRMLLANNLVGPFLRKWQQCRAVESRTKFQAIVLVGASVALLLFFSRLPTPMLAIVLALASVGLLVIYRLPTVKHESAS